MNKHSRELNKYASKTSFGSCRSMALLKRKATDDIHYFQSKLCKTISSNKMEEQKVAQLEVELEQHNRELLRLSCHNHNLRQQLNEQRRKIAAAESSALLSKQLQAQIEALCRVEQMRYADTK